MIDEKTKKLGRALIAKGIISKDALLRIWQECQKKGQALAPALIEQGVITQEQLDTIEGAASPSQNNSPSSPDSISPETLKLVPANIAKLYKIIPLKLSSGTLTVAMKDPNNFQTLDDLKFRLGFVIEGIQMSEDKINALLEKYYHIANNPSVDDMMHKIEADAMKDGKLSAIASNKKVDEASLKEAANQAPVIKLLNLILVQAVKDHASDIHFEPFENEFKVRYRVDGTLYEMAPPAQSLAIAITSRIKVMANLDISERRLPQDGRILMNIGDARVDLRVSTLPTAFGESCVIRVLDKSVVSLSLDQIGMDPELLKSFRQIIKKPNGIVLVTGPTGSGKTTTLYSALREINDINTKIITTEDPVEYDIDGIIQVPIKPKINLNYARCLRSILRQDPDVIMVGEIRDDETAQIAVQSSLTGHLVFSTLHTNDAPGAVTRLLDMQIEPFLITSSLEAVLAQRLVRTICSNCRETYTPTDDVIGELGIEKHLLADKKFYRGRGCEVCHFSGYKGRTGIYEFFVLNDVLKSLIIEKAPAVVLRQKAQEAGMKTLREYGIMKIFEGITSPDEVIRETQLFG